MHSIARLAWFLPFVVVSVSGCSTALIGVSEQEKGELAQAMYCPLIFDVSKAEADDAWGRAQTFVARFSTMKIQTATDYVLQTYNPAGSGINYGYSISRTPMGENMEMEVQCLCDNPFVGKDRDINAHIAAYYIRTGVLVCQKCISR